MLGQGLHKLERNGLVDRQVLAIMPATVKCGPIGTGRMSLAIIEDLREWSMSNIEAVSAARRAFDRRRNGAGMD